MRKRNILQNRKKLLFILPTLNMGGAEKVTVNIINSLDTSIFDITLIVIDSRYKNLESSISKDINLKYLNITKTRNSFFNIFIQIKMIKPDIVYSSLNRTNILILMIKLFYPFFKVVIREPSIPSVLIKQNYMSSSMLFLIRFLYHRATKIIAQTKYMKKEIEDIYNIDEKKVIVINNPLDKKSILSSIANKKNPFENYKESFNFVYVGRLSDEKNPIFLIDVFVEIIKNNASFNLFIIGDGYLKETIENKIFEKSLENNIHLLGFQKNPYPYIKCADGLLLSSKWEGMPNVVIEALYLETIVISTNSTPVLNDLIINSENGYIVDNFNVERFSENILNFENISKKFKEVDNFDFNKFFSGINDDK